MDTTVSSRPIGSPVTSKNWEGSLQRLISDVFGGNSYACELIALNLEMAASCRDQKEELLKQKVQIQNHAFQLGLDQAEEMRSAALARFVGAMVAGALGSVFSVVGATCLSKLSSSMSAGKTKAPDPTPSGTPQSAAADTPGQGGGSSAANSGGFTEPQGVQDAAFDSRTSQADRPEGNNRGRDAKAEHDHSLDKQNDAYRAQTQTQLVSMIFTQLVSQVTDSIKASGEYAGSIHDVEGQIVKTVRDAMMASADNMSEHYGVEKEAFENALRGVADTRIYSAFNNG
jgi:hypothetical protein